MRNLLLLLLLAIALPASAQTFSAYTADSVKLYYQVLKDKDVAVVAPPKKERPQGAVNIPPTVFYNDSTYQVVKIAENAFRGCNKMKSCYIPDGVIEIGPYAFTGCIRLESVQIPATVTIIERYAFYNCSDLQTVFVPAPRMAFVGDYAFARCTSLTSVRLPDIAQQGKHIFEGNGLPQGFVR